MKFSMSSGWKLPREKRSRATRRSPASKPRCPSVKACTSTLPMAVDSTGPATTTRSGDAGFVFHLRQHRPRHRAGRHQLREDSSRHPAELDEPVRPVASARVAKLRRAGIALIHARRAGEEVVEASADPVPQHAAGAFRAVVAVMGRRRQHRMHAVGVHVIHTPRIHAQARNGHSALRDLAETGLQFLKDSPHVPAQGTEHLHHGARETLHFLERELPLGKRREHLAPTVHTQVAGEVMMEIHGAGWAGRGKQGRVIREGRLKLDTGS